MIKTVVESINGNLRLVEFEKPLFSGRSHRDFSTKRQTDLQEEERKAKDTENLKRSARRAAKEIKQKILTSFSHPTNPPLKMYSCTFKRNEQNYESAVLCWERFVLLCRYRFDALHRYLCVVERQERGAFHFHCVTDSPFVSYESLLSTWREAIKEDGGIWISTDKDSKHGAVKYLTQYLTDEKYLTEIPKGKKRYFHTKDVKNSVKKMRLQTGIDEALEKVCSAFPLHVIDQDFSIENKYRGRIRVKEIDTGTRDSETVLKLEKMLF